MRGMKSIGNRWLQIYRVMDREKIKGMCDECRHLDIDVLHDDGEYIYTDDISEYIIYF